MKVSIGFTGLLKGVHNGDINLDEVDEIYVGCQPIHLASPGSDQLPLEVEWLHVEGRQRKWDAEGSSVPATSLHTEQIKTYRKVWNAMQDKPLFFCDANYWDAGWWLFENKDVDQVAVNGRWHEQERFKEPYDHNGRTPHIVEIKPGSMGTALIARNRFG